MCVLALATLGANGCSDSPREDFDPSRDERRDILPKGESTPEWFERSPIGEPVRGQTRPQISNVQIADLDADGLPDILACDVHGTSSR
jgi:hypothetical protein